MVACCLTLLVTATAFAAARKKKPDGFDPTSGPALGGGAELL